MHEIEITPELVGAHSINSFSRFNSSSRAVMTFSHMSQRLTPLYGDEKRFQTGMDIALGDATFSVKAPCDMRVLYLLDRYPKGTSISSIPNNPEIYVIYEDEVTKEIGYLSIPKYGKYHQYCGFELKPTNAASNLAPGKCFQNGEIFADTIAKKENGGYAFGKELNVAYMSFPAVAEDGFIVSEEALNLLTFKMYKQCVIEFGKDCFPLNLYGDLTNYKIFPEIGEYVRSDGIIMATRPMDANLAPCDVSIYDTMQIDNMFDNPIYITGLNGKIIDIKVYRNNRENIVVPDGMTSIADKYAHAFYVFNKELLAIEYKLHASQKNRYGTDKLALKPEFHRLLVAANAIVSSYEAKPKQRINLHYHKIPVDSYRVEFTIEYVVKPDIGYKLTCLSAGKGVICKIEKTENMPVDAQGNRAHVIGSAIAGIDRMIMGRAYEHFFGAVTRQVRYDILVILGINERITRSKALHFFRTLDVCIFNNAWSVYLEYLDIASPIQAEYVRNLAYDKKIENMSTIVCDKIYTYWPINNPIKVKEAAIALQNRFKPVYGPVSYIGAFGKKVTTKQNVRIAPLYMLLLEKMPTEWSAVASGKLQHFGVLSSVTKAEKNKYPYRCSSVRTDGETEVRINLSYLGPIATSEKMDRNNNPASHRMLYRNILEAKEPTNIDNAVNRDIIPLGGGKPLAILNHITTCAGFQFVYEPENN